jgi:Lrp/AsnC family transcriptional regulator for asnA, asnC and gidA
LARKNGFGPADFDDVDRQILRLLGEDGRRPNADIARLIGVSEPTVRKRLDRMIESGALKILPVLNAAATGYPVDAIIGIRVRPGSLRDVGPQLAAMGQIAYVGYVTGAYDILIEVLLRDDQHLFDFLAEGLEHIDGIVSTETFRVLSTEKFVYNWDIPAMDPVEATPRAGGNVRRTR